MFRDKCWSVQNKRGKQKTNPGGDWEAASGQGWGEACSPWPNIAPIPGKAVEGLPWGMLALPP